MNDITSHRRILQLSLCLLLVLIGQCAIIGGRADKSSCSDDEYWNNEGFCCNKCHPGFKLKQKCSAQGQSSVCEKCGDGTYLDVSNYNTNCFSCKDCKKPNMVKISNCTSKTNSECSCVDGYYMKMLSRETLECSPCKKCGQGQLSANQCTGGDYSHCVCKENHYSVKPNLCKPCDGCHEECKHLCNSSAIVKPSPPTDIVSMVVVPVCACIITLAVGVFMLYESIRLWKKRQRALSAALSSCDPSVKTEDKQLITVTPDPVIHNVLFGNQPCETEQCSKLPDCVPREIKIPEFIYFALDEIPVGRFKELVRRLCVSEQDIERAERDNRAFKDAQYQMLKVWCDRNSGGGNNILSCHLIQLFINTLKDMYLSSCADSIENKFLSQDRIISEVIGKEWR